MTKITRQSILAAAERCVCSDREEQYGPPEDNFQLIADLWSTYIGARRYYGGFGFEITAHDVAMLMCLLKIARTVTGEPKVDNFVDLAGYASCGGEIACGGKL